MTMLVDPDLILDSIAQKLEVKTEGSTFVELAFTQLNFKPLHTVQNTTNSGNVSAGVLYQSDRATDAGLEVSFQTIKYEENTTSPEVAAALATLIAAGGEDQSGSGCNVTCRYTRAGETAKTAVFRVQLDDEGGEVSNIVRLSGKLVRQGAPTA
jgi:hypothetical protein